jgi:hypothetical protein
MAITKRSISGSEKLVPAKHQQSKRLRCAAIVFNYRHYVAAYPPGRVHRAVPSDPTSTSPIYTRFSGCNRASVIVVSRTLNTNWEEKLTIRRTRRCHTTWRRAQNAVCLNGVGHDGDGPSAASSDASNHNFRTLMLARPVVCLDCWRRRRPGNRVGRPHGGDEKCSTRLSNQTEL